MFLLILEILKKILNLIEEIIDKNIPDIKMFLKDQSNSKQFKYNRTGVNNMQKVIVTGGAGFIGSNLVDELIKQEIEVIILDNLSTGKKENINPRAIFYECDVSNMNMNSFIYLFKDVDTIFHLAATPQVQYSIENPTDNNNLHSLINMLEVISLYYIFYMDKISFLFTIINYVKWLILRVLFFKNRYNTFICSLFWHSISINIKISQANNLSSAIFKFLPNNLVKLKLRICIKIDWIFITN